MTTASCIPSSPNEHRYNQGSGENQSHRETESVPVNTVALTRKRRKTGTSARKPKKPKRWSRHCHLCNKSVPSDANHPFLCETEICTKAVCANCCTEGHWIGKAENTNPFRCPHCLEACAAITDRKPQCARYSKYGKTRKQPQPTVQGGLMTVNSLPASGEIPPQSNFALRSRLSPSDAQFEREHSVATQSGQIQKTMQYALTQLSESLQGCPGVAHCP